MPISAPADRWTWVDIPGMKCGNGSGTGIGINPHAGAKRFFLYIQGGGACVDATTCWINPTATNMNGYAAKDFAADPTTLAAPFNRTDPTNPFKDADMVFVPYCTGDLHIGTAIAMYMVNGSPKPTYHYGGTNLDLALATLAVTFTGLDRIWFAGASAGGFGTILNQDFVVKAFGGGVRVDIIDDSGPAIDNGALGAPVQWAPRVPMGCAQCTHLPQFFAFDRMTYPMTRYGLLTYQTDSVLPKFYMETETQFAIEIQQFVMSLTSDPNAKSFMALSRGHVVLTEQDATAAPFILPWLAKLATDDPTWATEQH
jgi:hypothetical protein